MAMASWPTPNAQEFGANSETTEVRRAKYREKYGNNGFGLTTGQTAQLASWPTPMAGSPATDSYNEAGNNDSSRKTVDLVGWPTPVALLSPPAAWKEDVVWWKQSRAARNIEALAQETASWSTPRANKWGFPDAYGSHEKPLPISGPTSNGSPAATASRGQLNPDFSRWLMGYATEHLSCAPTATPSSLRSRRNSSKPSWK
jgi:hypothetical protein